ncbi:MAG: hypothetical protein KAT68_00320 [Bacteroidales bacterium]|nr:hypothetical protein [Bacteroidales bacterium]
MKKINIVSMLNLLVIILLLISSCRSDSSQENTNEETTELGEYNSEMALNEIKTTYKLPSPVELYAFLKDNNKNFQGNSINSVDKMSEYYTTTQKAVNFGVYASDMAYCIVFGKLQECFLYFSATKNLATELGITDGFGQIITDRIDKNLFNYDSLFQITSDSYWEACTFLEEQGKSNILSLIIAGGWIESLYISIKSVDEFSPDDKVVIRIAEQQILLENLLDFFNSLEEEEQINGIFEEFSELRDCFDELYDNPEDVIITKKQFSKISKKVNSIRKNIVS